ncbi:ParA family protein [Heliorestis convoluta]|uniref:AAA family ATPase n=1 Tax=Heliorestis convoluta TaxID=356322 RepID=A0A5Q2N683_9FIRM|nr:AAA family ATPase [Heliorestis convoluta]QGG48075.1 AAA family ATPase [Heliorestis convoluta]
MAKVISMINWKGGVGKTTLTLHLAVGLNQEYNSKVLLIDLDPQSNLSFLVLGYDKYGELIDKEKHPSLKRVFDSYLYSEQDHKPIHIEEVILSDAVQKNGKGETYEGVDLILSQQELVMLDLNLARVRKKGINHKEDTRYELERLSILHRLLQDAKERYEYIFLDCPPNLNLVTQNAFYTSNYYVIPAIPDFLSTTGITLIRTYMNRFNKDFEKMHAYAEVDEPYQETRFGGIIFNKVREQKGVIITHRETITEVKTKNKPLDLFASYITYGDGLAVASRANLPVYAYKHIQDRARSNAKKQAEYMLALVREFRERIK